MFDSFRNQYIWFHLNDTMSKRHGEENMNKKIWIAIVAVFVISAASLIAVMAYQGNPNVKGANYNTDVQQNLKQQ